MEGLFLLPVIKANIKAARQSNYELLILTIGMTSTGLTTWNVIYPVGPFDLEWYILHLFYYRQVASFI